jgi:hypothetical protein
LDIGVEDPQYINTPLLFPSQLIDIPDNLKSLFKDGVVGSKDIKALAAVHGVPGAFHPQVMLVFPIPAPITIRNFLIDNLLVHVTEPAGIITVSPSLAKAIAA